MTNCKECGCAAPAHLRYCAECGADNGCPNVRICLTEITDLNARYLNAYLSIDTRDIRKESSEFESLVSNKSFATMNRQIASLITWLSEENKPHKSYYKHIASGDRVPQDQYYDQVREKVDSALFPYFKEEMCFALLSFDNQGETVYGPCSIEFKDEVIASRATVFEENSIHFMDKRKISLTDNNTPIKSFRAEWGARGKLALCKLHSKIDKDMTEQDLSNLLYTPSSPVEAGNGDFIEVHIYGDISKKTIKRISIDKNVISRNENIKIRMLKAKAKALGITVEEI